MKRMLAVAAIISLTLPAVAAAQGYDGLIAPPDPKTQQQKYEAPKGGYSGVMSWDKKTDSYGQNAQPQTDNLYDYIQEGGDPQAKTRRLQAESAEQMRQRSEEIKARRLKEEQERQAKVQAAIDKVNADNQQLIDNASRQAEQWQQQGYGQ